jgi:phosphonate transport system permease protein
MAVVLAERTWRRRTTRTQLAVWAAWLLSAAIFVYCFELISDRTIWTFVTDAPAQAGDLAVRMVPPDWGYIRQLGRPIWDTINIATIGTAAAVVLAIPVA